MATTVLEHCSWQGRPTRAIVDLDAVEQNVRALRRRIGPRSSVWAVVKANGYGHGAAPVAQAAIAGGATRACVAITAEGVQLRDAGIAAPIVILGYTPPCEAGTVVDHDLVPTVTTRDTAIALATAARSRGVTLPVHVKVDTGMNRFGVAPEDFRSFLEFLRTLPTLRLDGVFTHFATADERDKTFCRRQFEAFVRLTSDLGPDVLRHAGNSAAAIDLPETALDAVRPGVAMYGLYPSADTSKAVALQPALSLESTVARVARLRPGDAVSYGLTWKAERDAVVALVPCGYADGLRRALSSRGRVLVHGRPAPIVGRVCMDQCVVDVTEIPNVRIGDRVTVIGANGEEEVTADEHAALADTINYEIVCGISERVPRLYVRGGELVAVRDSFDRLPVAP